MQKETDNRKETASSANLTRKALCSASAIFMLSGATPIDKKLYETIFSPSNKKKQSVTVETEKNRKPEFTKVSSAQQKPVTVPSGNALTPDAPVLKIWSGIGRPELTSISGFLEETVIERQTTETWWFRWKTHKPYEFALWQAAVHPFRQELSDWKTSEGLIGSGPVIIQAGLGSGDLFGIELDELDLAERKHAKVYFRIIIINTNTVPEALPSNSVTATILPLQ
ncbi:MAG: hypothetical protein J7D60_04700 [Prosthecochloris sp.]|nr:hypothetical protein [Prosthecochloris sp.]